ncbi:MAG: hypothetical protein EXR75_07575, partial [Myxococcales bacterium]|nr:hypothetical protein [Myxococcales bacterium]
MTGQQATGQQATGQQATGQLATGQQATGQQATGQQATGQQATGQQATGPMTEALFPHWREGWTVHQDEHLLAVDKSCEIPVHASDDPEHCDLVTRIQLGLGVRPTVVHGLDREASGLVVLALTKEGARGLAQSFASEEHGRVARTHIVAVSQLQPFLVARPERGLLFRATILREHDGRGLVAIETDARRLELRKKLAELGAPIAGDRDHGGPAAPRLMWHVAELRLTHPTTGQPLAVRCEPPREFDAWLAGDDALPTDPAELARRIEAAALRRYALGRMGDTDALRLVHGAGDALPGIELDLYAGFAVLALSSPEALVLEDVLLDCVAGLGVRGVYLKRRPKQASRLVETRRAEVAPSAPSRGEAAPPLLVVRELGVEYLVRLGDGLSTGLFLDQLRARAIVRERATGARVLNLFSYHAAFTVAAIAGGARSSVSVDASGAANVCAAENLAHRMASPAHALVTADAKAWLERHARDPKGDRFELIVLDPPSFATTKSSTFRADRDLVELATLAFRCLTESGALLCSTNLRTMSTQVFTRSMREAATRANRKLARVVELGVPLDFPPAPGKPPHLKSALAIL